MSLSSLSSNSLSRIFKSLGDRASTITLLRRTCQNMDILARKGGFDKVEATYIELGGPVEEPDGVYVAICREMSEEEQDFIWDQKPAENRKYKNKKDTRNYKKIIQIHKDLNYGYDDFKETRPILYEMLPPLFDKVKVVKGLVIKNLIVNDDLIIKLMEFSEHLSSLNHIAIVHKFGAWFMEILASSEQLSNLLQIGEVESLYCESYDLTMIEDKHIQNLQKIGLNSDRFGLSDYLGITDATINAWTENIPEIVEFKRIRTSITFGTLWNFILLIVDSRTGNYEYTFGTINLRDVDWEMVTKSQKEPGFQWSTKNYGQEMMYEVIFADSDGTSKFKFYVNLEND